MSSQYKTPLHFQAFKPFLKLVYNEINYTYPKEDPYLKRNRFSILLYYINEFKNPHGYLKTCFKNIYYYAKLEDYHFNKSEQIVESQRINLYKNLKKELNILKNELIEFLKSYHRILKQTKKKRKIIKLLKMFRILFYNKELIDYMNMSVKNTKNLQCYNISKCKHFRDWKPALELELEDRSVKSPRIFKWNLSLLSYKKYGSSIMKCNFHVHFTTLLPVINDFSEIPKYIKKLLSKIDLILFYKQIKYTLTYLPLPRLCIRLVMNFVFN